MTGESSAPPSTSYIAGPPIPPYAGVCEGGELGIDGEGELMIEGVAEDLGVEIGRASCRERVSIDV